MRLAVGLLAVAIVSVAAQTLAAASPPDTSAGARALAGVGPVTPGRAVTLITGDSVRIAHDAAGRTFIEGVSARHRGVGAAFQTIRDRGHVYVIPASARPFLGRILDVSLFDVSRSPRAGARIPVQLSFAGARTPSVPGVTITSEARGSASGYLTPKSAVRFGAALVQQYNRAAKAGFPAHSSLFGLTRLASPLAAPPDVHPDYPMRTLILKVLGSNGEPLRSGVLLLYNTDDFAKAFDFVFVVRGEARVSVPIGTYGLDLGIDERNAAGHFAGFGVVTKSDIHVTHQDQVVTVDGSTATSRLSVITPKPADQEIAEFDISRESGNHRGFLDDGYVVGGSGTISVAPASQPKSGTLTSIASWTLGGQAPTQAPYSYSLSFGPEPGIPADESHTLHAKDVATFKSRFYVDGSAREGQLITFPIVPGSDGGGGFSTGVPLPANLVQYVNAIPRAAWLTTLFASPNLRVNPFAGTIDDSPRLAPAGSVFDADWGRGPALPNVPVDTSGSGVFGGYGCLSCRTAGRIFLGLAFATDTTPGHTWELFGARKPVASIALYRNGTLVSRRLNRGLVSAKVPAARATYRLVDHVNRVPSLALQSRTTTTDITFRSTAGKGGTLPASWGCPLRGTCTVLPLLRTQVGLPTNLLGSVPRGTSSITLTLSHVAGAPQTPITSGKVQIRPSGGSRWKTLPIASEGNGLYLAALHLGPAAAQQTYDLRVSGTDAYGGKIVQTATDAFIVSAS